MLTRPARRHRGAGFAQVSAASSRLGISAVSLRGMRGAGARNSHARKLLSCGPEKQGPACRAGLCGEGGSGSLPVKHPAQEKFGGRVLRADLAHVSAAPFRAELVHAGAFLDGQVKRKIGNVPQPLAGDHNFQRLHGIAVLKFLYGSHEFRQSEMIHTINIASAEGNC